MPFQAVAIRDINFEWRIRLKYLHKTSEAGNSMTLNHNIIHSFYNNKLLRVSARLSFSGTTELSNFYIYIRRIPCFVKRSYVYGIVGHREPHMNICESSHFHEVSIV